MDVSTNISIRMWFQKDGEPLIFGRLVRSYIDNTFPANGLGKVGPQLGLENHRIYRVQFLFVFGGERDANETHVQPVKYHWNLKNSSPEFRLLRANCGTPKILQVVCLYHLLHCDVVLIWKIALVSNFCNHCSLNFIL